MGAPDQHSKWIKLNHSALCNKNEKLQPDGWSSICL